jgi:hypothetical protein
MTASYNLSQLGSNYLQGGTGSVARTTASKLQESVSVLDFGADPTGVSDSTTAFTNASNVGSTVIIPAGTYKLTNFRPQKSGQSFIGSGYGTTIIQQGSTSYPAINCLSDVSTGQLLGMNFSGFKVVGATSATVAGFVVQATTPYVVGYSNFDFQASGCYSSLQIVTTGANEVYSNTFRVWQYNSTNTGYVSNGGVYNTFSLFITGSANGVAINDTSSNSVFLKAVSDGAQIYAGINCTILDPTVEAWTGSSYASAALNFTGQNHRVIGAQLTNVPNAKLGLSSGIYINSYNISLLGYRVIGTQPATAPQYPIYVVSGATGTFADCLTSGCAYKLEQYVAFTDLSNFQFVGDCTALTNFSQRPLKFGKSFASVSGTTYTVDAAYTSAGLDPGVVVAASGSCTVTLPSGSIYTGRTLTVLTRNAQTVVSASSNVVPITGGAAGTAILAATAGKWATLQYDGSSWNIIASN